MDMTIAIEPAFPVRVGRCIYCRTTDEPLTDEHIIPFALEGEWVLQHASCDRCARITGAVERELLRGELLAFRTKLEFRTRRKRERPSSLPIAFTRDGAAHTANLPIELHPAPTVLPIFEAPGLYDPNREAPDEPRVCGLAELRAPDEHFEAVAKLGASEYTLRWPSPITFARFIAKVGYGFAVGALGLDRIEPFVVGAILSADAPIGRWVGSLKGDQMSPEAGLHAVTLAEVDGTVIAYVRLFAQFGIREYVVVVGQLAP